MNHMNRLFAVASAAFFIASSALAQNAGTVANHAVPIGKGPGVQGFGSAAPSTAGLPLTSNGASVDPSFQALLGSSITGAALTKTDDTNVTLTLGGTPTASLLRAASLTLGWTGQLSVPRGGTGLASGQSGGVPCYNTTTSLLSSTALALNGVMVGGGVGACPGAITAGTNGQLLLGVTSSAPQMATMSADATISNAGALTLATVNANVGTFGSATSCVTVTNNAKGLTTAISAATCAPAVGSITGLGTGVATALGVNVGSAGAFVTFNGALGTPSSGTLTNATGLPIASGVANLGTGVATFLTTPSSANLRAALTDEVGTGAAYFVGGALGTPASGTATNLTGLPLSGLTTQGAFTFVGNNTSGAAAPTAVDIALLTTKASPAAGDYVILSDQAASGAWKKASVSALASAGSVASIAGNTGAFTLGVGLTNSVNDIKVSLSTASNSLGADVAMNNTANYFDGPSMAQGTSGTWWVSGGVTVLDSAGASDIYCKLWDGTTVISSGYANVFGAFSGNFIALSGFLSSPAANIRISCRDNTRTTGLIKFNSSGNSKDSSISGIRIQ